MVRGELITSARGAKSPLPFGANDVIALHIRSEVAKLEPQRTQRTQRFTEKYLFYIPIDANWFDAVS